MPLFVDLFFPSTDHVKHVIIIYGRYGMLTNCNSLDYHIFHIFSAFNCCGKLVLSTALDLKIKMPNLHHVVFLISLMMPYPIGLLVFFSAAQFSSIPINYPNNKCDYRDDCNDIKVFRILIYVFPITS